MNLSKKCTTKPYSFLVIDATLASDNPSRVKKYFKKNIKTTLIMTIEKLQYDIDREAAKISALLSGKINENEYLPSE